MRAPIVAIVALCLAVPLWAAGNAPFLSEPGWTATAKVDWASAALQVEITRDLDPSTASLVRAKADAETDVDGRLPDLLARAISTVQVDSSHLYGAYLQSDPGLFARVSDLAEAARLVGLSLSGDFSRLVARYDVPLFGDAGIATPLFPSQASPIRRRLGDVTTRKYTGLLIFAQGPLPEAGTSRMTRARPAVFPRIWDEQMNLVLDRTMCSPESLARWGMVGYAQSLDDPAADLRVGALPLRLSARGVFGDTPTDIVISTDGARQLLALPENIAFLREGRIVIVYDSLN
ncbi:MAG TPA: hypothetical protein VHE79_02825 [Spirochaetia bacterium]